MRSHSGWSGPSRHTGPMRLSEFWERMSAQFGEAYASHLARHHVFAELGGRTIDEALAEGVPTKDVWRAVCVGLELPESVR